MRLAFPDPPLSAGGIVLRGLRMDDDSWIAAACGDRELSRYIPAIPYPYSLADACSFVQRSQREWAGGTAATFAIGQAPHGDGLGTVALHFNVADPAMAEVGYWLRPEARGRGAATIAVRLVSGWAFRDLSIERLNLLTAPGNVASQRVAGRAGFTREGLLRAWVPAARGRDDNVMFSLLPRDARSEPA